MLPQKLLRAMKATLLAFTVGFLKAILEVVTKIYA